MNRYEFLEKWALLVPSDKKEEFEKEFLSILLGNQYIDSMQRKKLVADYNDDLG